MAIKTVHQLIDDIDGGEATRTINFAFDGLKYEIDLNDEHVREFSESMQRWIQHGRRATGPRRSFSRTTTRRPDLDKVREWAREQGHEVSDRGRVPNHILDAYDASH